MTENNRSLSINQAKNSRKKQLTLDIIAYDRMVMGVELEYEAAYLRLLIRHMRTGNPIECGKFAQHILRVPTQRTAKRLLDELVILELIKISEDKIYPLIPEVRHAR